MYRRFYKLNIVKKYISPEVRISKLRRDSILKGL